MSRQVNQSDYITCSVERKPLTSVQHQEIPDLQLNAKVATFASNYSQYQTA